jgi:hypothetical protein
MTYSKCFRLNAPDLPDQQGAPAWVATRSRRDLSVTGIVALAAVFGLMAPDTDARAAPSTALQGFRVHATPALRLIQTSGSFRVADAAGPSGQPLPLRVILPDNATASYSFLMFRNLPPDFRLSAGFGTKTYWAVSLQDIEGLQILPSDNFTGALTLEVLLIKTLGSDPERVTVNVEFQPAGGGGRVLTSTPPDTTAALAEKNVGSGERNPRDARLVDEPRSNAGTGKGAPMSASDRAQLDRGDAYLRQGDVASARLIYLQLARKNIAEGAFGMANTFDPEYLETLGVRGLKPDLVEAKKWYAKAQSLGSSLAARRLSTLGR